MLEIQPQRFGKRLIVALAKSTQYHGYKNETAPPFLNYEIFKTVDLRDPDRKKGDSSKIPIKDRIAGQPQQVEAYLVEAQTFEGLSGAPVFQREMVAMRDLFSEHNGGLPIVETGAQLLGVYAGAWEGEPSATLASDRNWGPDKRIPAGMGIVVPGERILEVVMNDPELKKYRAEIHQKRRAERDT